MSEYKLMKEGHESITVAHGQETGQIISITEYEQRIVRWRGAVNAGCIASPTVRAQVTSPSLLHCAWVVAEAFLRPRQMRETCVPTRSARDDAAKSMKYQNRDRPR